MKIKYMLIGLISLSSLYGLNFAINSQEDQSYDVYISGAVKNPGKYKLHGNQTIAKILNKAKVKDNANVSKIDFTREGNSKIYIPYSKSKYNNKYSSKKYNKKPYTKYYNKDNKNNYSNKPSYSKNNYSNKPSYNKYSNNSPYNNKYLNTLAQNSNYSRYLPYKSKYQNDSMFYANKKSPYSNLNQIKSNDSQKNYKYNNSYPFTNKDKISSLSKYRYSPNKMKKFDNDKKNNVNNVSSQKLNNKTLNKSWNKNESNRDNNVKQNNKSNTWYQNKIQSKNHVNYNKFNNDYLKQKDNESKYNSNNNNLNYKKNRISNNIIKNKLKKDLNNGDKINEEEIKTDQIRKEKSNINLREEEDKLDNYKNSIYANLIENDNNFKNLNSNKELDRFKNNHNNWNDDNKCAIWDNILKENQDKKDVVNLNDFLLEPKNPKAQKTYHKFIKLYSNIAKKWYKNNYDRISRFKKSQPKQKIKSMCQLYDNNILVGQDDYDFIAQISTIK